MQDMSLCISFSAPLHEADSPEVTYGCRQTNPNICKYNGLEGVCAFTRDDCLCLRPSRAWKRQFQKLQEAKNE